VEFNVEAAKADGLSDEEIQKLIAAGPPSIRNEEITTEETGVTPTPVQAPPKTKPTFNVEAAKADGLSDEEIQKLIAAGPPKQPTFNVEAAKADGLSDEEIQKLIAAGPPKQPTFNVEAAKADGLSDEEIQKLIAAGPPKTQTQTSKEKGFGRSSRS
jgi:alkylhydroperoxidase/carboxymuconolactone decarboxylase family protein YurZ